MSSSYTHTNTESPALKPANCPAQETSCWWFVQQCAEPPFLLLVPFSDGIVFVDGIINFDSHHQWAEGNPQGVLNSRHQEQFSINVLVGTAGDCFIGPRVLPRCLTGDNHRDLLLNGLHSCMIILQHISAILC